MTEALLSALNAVMLPTRRAFYHLLQGRPGFSNCRGNSYGLRDPNLNPPPLDLQEVLQGQLRAVRSVVLYSDDALTNS